MNREFKFRAFEFGKMYYQVRVGGMFDGEATSPTNWNGSDWVNLTGGKYTKVMQYTGLKDIQGKEIYEGDIIEGNRIFRYSDEQFNPKLNGRKEYRILFVVEFSEGKFVAKNIYNTFSIDLSGFNGYTSDLNIFCLCRTYTDDNNRFGNYSSSETKLLNVIGNIYENTELLEEKEE